MRDLDGVGELLAAVVGSGANTVSEVSSTVGNPDALMDQARQEVLAQAAIRAQQMAAALEVTLGKPISVVETGGGYPDMAEGIGGARAEMVAPPISPGPLSVSVSIQVVYEIQ